MRWLLLIALAACNSARADDDRAAAGIKAFATVYAVLEHPRCRNCHPAGDAPLQYDDGRPHGQNVTRLSTQNGLTCATCHRAKNGTRPNTPPGAPRWQLPPAQTPMVFEGRTAAQLCAQLKDPAQTGNRNLDQIVEHVAKDPLVAWGWDPGPGRTPVPIDRAVALASRSCTRPPRRARRARRGEHEASDRALESRRTGSAFRP
jgi:hypothetical protein